MIYIRLSLKQSKLFLIVLLIWKLSLMKHVKKIINSKSDYRSF